MPIAKTQEQKDIKKAESAAKKKAYDKKYKEDHKEQRRAAKK